MTILASPNQIKYLQSLITQRDLLKSDKVFDAVNAMDAEEFEQYREHLRQQATTLSRSEASKWIDRLKVLPARLDGTPLDVTPVSPSDKQRTLIARLLEERDVPEEFAAEVRDQLAGNVPFSRQDASRTIERLKVFAIKDAETYETDTEPLPDVPEGYYAFDKGLVDVPELGLVEDVYFIAVDRPEKGRWAGRTFVNQVSGGGFGNKGVRHPIKDRDLRRILLTTIKQVGIQEAAQLYGQKIGRCGCCNRNLTDPVSRAYGIGPDCRKQQGWS